MSDSGTADAGKSDAVTRAEPTSKLETRPRSI